MARWIGYWPSWSPTRTRPGSWSGRSRWIPRSLERISTRRAQRGPPRGRRRTRGARSNHKNRSVGRDEPDDHGIGRSRGGLSTKAHALVDGKGRLLTLIIGPGHAGDSPVLPLLLNELSVARRGRGRPRITPDALRADRAYCSRGHRALLRSRGIKVVIPEKKDQAAHRKRRGRAGGRPVTHDAEDYRNRNVVERFFNRMKHWRGLASRYDKYATVYRGGIILAAIIDWLKHLRDTA